MSSAGSVLLIREREQGAKGTSLESAIARVARAAPWLVVGAAVVWNLVVLHPETRAVAYLDDSSVHAQMVRFATAQLSAGHLPLTSWFPYLGLGSPQFLHYQSLPAMLTGLFGIAVGPGVAFRWSLYLLMSLWPISVYLSARLFGLGRWGSAAAALFSPFLVSATHVGYEQGAYVWIGYGVWTQLWAMVTLPLAWGLGWRAIRDGRRFLPAVLAVAVTAAFHFETGYLAVLPLLAWPFVAPSKLRERVGRSAVVLIGALVASAWVVVPLLVERPWAATNEVLHRTPLVNGYGASRVLGWLFTGQVLDSGRLPVITVFAGIGVLLALRRWRVDEDGRALIVALAICLLFSFGRATFGDLADAIPGSADLFFRRFMMGVQLAAVLLAGGGAALCGRWLRRAVEAAGRRPPWRRDRATRAIATAVLATAGAVLVLAPAWSGSLAYARRNSAAISAQVAADRAHGSEVDRLIALVKRDGGGRVYAGMPSNWGMSFGVGAVPVFKYLESRDVDEVGYTLRTASLMTNPEYYFDERNPSDYLLFGVRYLVLPAGRIAPVPSLPLECEGPYCLREIQAGGYVHLGRLVGTLDVNRSNIGARTIGLLRSHLAAHGDYVRARFTDRTGGGIDFASGSVGRFHGTVISESSAVRDGRLAATVRLERGGLVVFSTSFDPGWTATVDGRRTQVISVAPALVAARVPAGRHSVVFRYQGFSLYPLLFAISALALVVVAAIDRVRRSRPRPA